MKISELWLREWINPPISTAALCQTLTMAGLEVEEVISFAEKISNVIVAKIIDIKKHPDAERLNICEVSTGDKNFLIVCGAKNVKVGMKAPLAVEGAILPNNMQIKATKIRGVSSNGMLCSLKELGLAEESEGIFALPDDAPLGKEIWDYLKLADQILTLSITPNRGDCLSISGLTHEVAALTKTKAIPHEVSSVAPSIQDIFSVVINEAKDCPHYVGRIIRNVKADVTTPIWMQERLRRSDIRCISPIVDVMNYVMMELGQPMHAFDFSKIEKNIVVRHAKLGETLKLLDGQIAELDPETLIIADEKNPLAIAGVMGGFDSAVTLLTEDIFLESAFFTPLCIARSVRKYGFGSESSYRFERGVDPELQIKALERATQLILEIAGGNAGPINEVVFKEYLPATKIILLRHQRINQILGVTLSDHEIESVFTGLKFNFEKKGESWQVTVPARRFDITLEVDLIEEIIRVLGYDKIPLSPSISALQIVPQLEEKISLATLRSLLNNLGYQEIISYSFVDKKLLALFDSESTPKELVNPIAAGMEAMRTTFWPGLINALQYNQNRQQSRIRIYEIGLRFITKNEELLQQNMLSGLVTGAVFPEQWNNEKRLIDFFDLKGDLENLFQLTGTAEDFTFRANANSALHPGQSAAIYRKDQCVGSIGALHPSLQKQLDLVDPVFLFELALDQLEEAKLPHFADISKFPSIRRDIAILVDDSIPVRQIQDTIVNVAGDLLQATQVFDVYQGKGVAMGKKSIAFSLTLQHPSRTLVDREVSDLMDRIINALISQFAAELRG